MYFGIGFWGGFFFPSAGNGTCSVRILPRTVCNMNIIMVYLKQATGFGQIMLVYRAPRFASELIG